MRISLPCGLVRILHLRSRLQSRSTNRGVDRVASAVVDMLAGSAMAELGRRTIVMGTTKSWFTPAVKTAARRRRAALHLMLCRPYDASARSDMVAAD